MINSIVYFITKLRLLFAKNGAVNAKKAMDCAIRNTRSATGEIDRSYNQFLEATKKQELLAVKLKRLQTWHSDFPILKHQIKTGTLDVTDSADNELTRLDIELALVHHSNCDWGKVDVAQWNYNNAAALKGFGLIRSKYEYFGGKNFFIDTDIRNKRTLIHLEGDA